MMISMKATLLALLLFGTSSIHAAPRRDRKQNRRLSTLEVQMRVMNQEVRTLIDAGSDTSMAERLMAVELSLAKADLPTNQQFKLLTKVSAGHPIEKALQAQPPAPISNTTLLAQSINVTSERYDVDEVDGDVYLDCELIDSYYRCTIFTTREIEVELAQTNNQDACVTVNAWALVINDEMEEIANLDCLEVFELPMSGIAGECTAYYSVEPNTVTCGDENVEAPNKVLVTLFTMTYYSPTVQFDTNSFPDLPSWLVDELSFEELSVRRATEFVQYEEAIGRKEGAFWEAYFEVKAAEEAAAAAAAAAAASNTTNTTNTTDTTDTNSGGTPGTATISDSGTTYNGADTDTNGGGA